MEVVEIRSGVGYSQHFTTCVLEDTIQNVQEKVYTRDIFESDS